MGDLQILLAERTEGILSRATKLLRQDGFGCTYTNDTHALAIRLHDETVDILLVDEGLVTLAFSHLLEAHAEPAQRKSGYMVELPGYDKSGNSPHLRRSVLQYLCQGDSAEDIADFVRLAMPRVTVLRKARDAARYLSSIREALQRAKKLHSEMTALPEGVRDEPAIEAITQAVELGDAFESLSMFVRPADTGCRYQQCTRFAEMGRSIKDAVDVLRASKNQFKSKELGELRKRLEATLDSCMFSGGDSSLSVGEAEQPL